MTQKFDLTRADTALYLDKDGSWKRGAVNYPQATNYVDDIGTYFRGTWIPKPLTNLFRNSEPASNPGQGTRTAITFNACDWALGFNTALDGMVTFGDNSTNRFYLNTADLTPSTVYTFACIIKPDNGVEPTFGTTSSDIGRFLITDRSITSGYTVIDLGSDLFLVSVSSTSFETLLPNNGMAKTSVNNSIGFEISAMMIVQGTVTWDSPEDYLLDYIRTTGSSIARATTDIRKTDFPKLASLQGFIDVEFTIGSATQLLCRIGTSNSFNLGIAVLSTGVIRMAYIVNNVTLWKIDSTALTMGHYRIGFYLSSGNNILFIDAVEVATNSSAYIPQGSIFVCGGEITGTTNKLTDGGFFGLYIDSGITEAKLLEESAWDGLEDSSAFKRTTFDDFAYTESIYNLLASTTL